MKKNIFRDLGTLMSAGMDPASAIKKLASISTHPQQFKDAAKYIDQGKSLSEALFKYELISKEQASWLHAAESCGQTDQALQTIERAQTKRESRLKLVKGKLLYPLFILLVAILSTAAVDLFSDQPAMNVFFMIGLKLGVIYFITKIFFSLLKKDVFYWLTKLDSHQKNKKYQLFFDQICISSLYYLSQSSVDYATAFKLIANYMTSKELKQKLLKASSLCQQGISISQSIIKADLPASYQCQQLLLTAESTGDWHSTMGVYLDNNQKYIDDILMDWVKLLQKGLFVIAASVALSVIL
ncbi:type II secretion system F family protein [Marinicellulosiphila megalodicopiae]|uniref:type II secretion system F family protein n=1 Tax=Marinicellulosiphila megalodicopiae TaxID=2724896 RepID=UPI003BAF64EC